MELILLSIVPFVIVAVLYSISGKLSRIIELLEDGPKEDERKREEPKVMTNEEKVGDRVALFAVAVAVVIALFWVLITYG